MKTAIALAAILAATPAMAQRFSPIEQQTIDINRQQAAEFRQQQQMDEMRQRQQQFESDTAYQRNMDQARATSLYNYRGY